MSNLPSKVPFFILIAFYYSCSNESEIPGITPTSLSQLEGDWYPYFEHKNLLYD